MTCECGKELVVLYRSCQPAPPSRPLSERTYRYYACGVNEQRGNKSIRLDTRIQGPYCPDCDGIKETRNEWWDDDLQRV
ncbi:hypothetical protein LCGC14_1752510 [marine sediment metagenome]|uniref:Uncharacterized protein n=1 Tax=marine sediment metagenome TaxID=412755 RepID=A0A0F9HQU1_9ZZZZ